MIAGSSISSFPARDLLPLDYRSSSIAKFHSTVSALSVVSLSTAFAAPIRSIQFLIQFNFWSVVGSTTLSLLHHYTATSGQSIACNCSQSRSTQFLPFLRLSHTPTHFSDSFSFLSHPEKFSPILIIKIIDMGNSLFASFLFPSVWILYLASGGADKLACYLHFTLSFFARKTQSIGFFYWSSNNIFHSSSRKYCFAFTGP